MLFSFDHDDFSKARRALFVSSVVLLVVQTSQISDGPINLLGLDIQFTHERLILWLKLLVVYFFMIFSVRVFQEIDRRHIDDLEKLSVQAKSIYGSTNEEERKALTMIFDGIQKVRSGEISKPRLVFQTKFVLFFLADIVPPVAIATLGLTSWGERIFDHFL
ncbi:hypothetical protein [Thioclava sp. F36-7]|uniref:hypothetical protein n=1 Tax=Thioclava sp. F36-7 TaxID=1915317 RepID=UPI000998158D|nr:hypothetical protein [Thioclava sp. F36-7]OOY10614.1 hypothetical protein BMI89_01550 [Thioclava sp. F36-7]